MKQLRRPSWLSSLLACLVIAGCGGGGGGFFRGDAGTGDMTARPGDMSIPTASCTDGRANGDETDVDCGGSCGRCALGKACRNGNDCVSGNCTSGFCFPAEGPTCVDGAKNGNETDVDCGGGDCARCANGRSCGGNNDCLSSRCQGGSCVPGASCTDGMKNGNETGVDCGGGTCPRCPDLQGCVVNSDCQSNRCSGGTCVANATCNDGIQNGNETDTDCGGGTCPKCANGLGCNVNSDCSGNRCSGGVCTAGSSCANGIQDGNETDTDCGGGTCPKCPDGLACNFASDCQSGSCTQNTCGGGMPFTCIDAVGCLINCPDQTCANQCFADINTVNGKTRLNALLSCLEATCPSTNGGPCDDVNNPNSGTQCPACYQAAQMNGGACYAPLIACQNDA